jgi:hypothetical protein
MRKGGAFGNSSTRFHNLRGGAQNGGGLHSASSRRQATPPPGVAPPPPPSSSVSAAALAVAAAGGSAAAAVSSAKRVSVLPEGWCAAFRLPAHERPSRARFSALLPPCDLFLSRTLSLFLRANCARGTKCFNSWASVVQPNLLYCAWFELLCARGCDNRCYVVERHVLPPATAAALEVSLVARTCVHAHTLKLRTFLLFCDPPPPSLSLSLSPAHFLPRSHFAPLKLLLFFFLLFC